MTLVASSSDAQPARARCCGGVLTRVLLRDGFPVNVLDQIKEVPEVCRIYCATANPTFWRARSCSASSATSRSRAFDCVLAARAVRRWFCTDGGGDRWRAALQVFRAQHEHRAGRVVHDAFADAP